MHAGRTLPVYLVFLISLNWTAADDVFLFSTCFLPEADLTVRLEACQGLRSGPSHKWHCVCKQVHPGHVPPRLKESWCGLDSIRDDNDALRLAGADQISSSIPLVPSHGAPVGSKRVVWFQVTKGSA